MSKTMYRIEIIGRMEIHKIDVIKETKKQVVYVHNGREIREAKESAYAFISDHPQKCKDWMIKRTEGNLKRKKRSLENAEHALEKAMNINTQNIKYKDI